MVPFSLRDRECHLQELPVHSRADLVELAQHRMLDDVDANLCRKDLAALPHEAAVGNPRAAVVHLLSDNEQEGQAQMKTLHHILAGHHEQLAAVKALEDGACGIVTIAMSGPESGRKWDLLERACIGYIQTACVATQ